MRGTYNGTATSLWLIEISVTTSPSFLSEYSQGMGNGKVPEQGMQIPGLWSVTSKAVVSREGFMQLHWTGKELCR